MILPKMGESVFECTVLNWLKQVGDTVEVDESLLEVATDKVDTEVPATVNGVLKQMLVPQGQVAKIGEPIAIIETAGASVATEDTQSAAELKELLPLAAQIETAQEMLSAQLSAHGANGFYSPLVRSIAKQEGISQQELEAIAGTGSQGRVTKRDILAYVQARKTGAQPAAAAAPAPAASATPVAAQPAAAPAAPLVAAQPMGAGDEVIEMDRMRRMIADRMVDSKRVSPHVTSFVEADLTNLVHWRNKHKKAFQQREGQNLTFMPLFVHAIVKAIKDFPMINVQVDGSRIIKKKDINIGMAVALPNGNLIVPVIKQADRLSLAGLTIAINDLAQRARENKLKPDELQGGTYTISNIGSFGNVMGTPIINQPQVAIMAIGAIRKKPAVIETPQGDLIGIRQFAYFSHSYDHRVVDGALGGMFVRRVCDYLEQWDMAQDV